MDTDPRMRLRTVLALVNGLCAALGITTCSALAGAETMDLSPPHMVAFFTAEECPTRWQVPVNASGRLLLAVSNGSHVGMTYGTPLADQQPPTHNHTFQGTITLPKKELKGAKGSNHQGARAGSFQAPTPPGTTDSASVTMPYIQLVVCEKDSTSGGALKAQGDPYPVNTVAFFNTSSCKDIGQPWTSAAVGQCVLSPQCTATQCQSGSPACYPAVDGYFLVPFGANMTPTQSGAAYGAPITVGQDVTHTHTFRIPIALNSVQYEKTAAAPQHDLTPHQTDTLSGQTSSASAGMPYIAYLLCQKSSGGHSPNPPTSVPADITIFIMTQFSCPNGWKATQQPPGFSLLGLPQGGTPYASVGQAILTPGHRPTHTHTLSGSVNISSEGMEVAKGTDSPSYGAQGTYPFHVSSDSPSAGLPYIAVRQCQPCLPDDPDCQPTQESQR